MLVPPENCGLVEPGIYRCSKLDPDNFPYLDTLELRSIVLVDAEKPPGPLKRFIELKNIDLYNLGALKISNHHHTGASSSSGKSEEEETASSASGASRHQLEVIPVNTTKSRNDSWMLIEKNLIVQAFELLLDKSKHNLLLVDSSLTLVGILRKMQKWNFNSVVNEYRTFASTNGKNSYFAETFLELVEPELIPFEVHRLSETRSDHSLRTSPDLPRRSRRASRTSVEDSDNYSDNSVENVTESLAENTFDDDDMDDAMLSASPQIPTNLLKLVELRKDRDDADPDITPSSSPHYTRTSRNNSFTSDMLLAATRSNFDRRRSSLDALARAGSSSRRPVPRTDRLNGRDSFSRGSFGESLREFKDSFRREDDAERAQQKYGYYYYKSTQEGSHTFEDVNSISIKLPPEAKLPGWFRRQRDCWEERFRRLNGMERESDMR